MNRTTLTVCALLSFGCAEEQMSKYALPPAAEVVDTPRALRLDVYPPGNLGLLPQSFTVLPGDIEDVFVALAPTVEIDGVVFGEIPSPVDITIPSEEAAPVEARVTLEIPNTVMRGVTTSAPDGSFRVEVPSGFGYRAVAVALEPNELPLYLETGLAIAEATTLDIDLALGVPVSGTVLQDDGSLLPSDARVQLVDAFTGEKGPPATLTDTGEYLLRALPGDYTIILSGSASGTIPNVPFDVTVEPDTLSVRKDLEPGFLSASNVTGAIVDEDGRSVDDCEVRFTAVSLTDLPAEASAVVATDSDRNGLFNRTLAHGTWLMEVIPTYTPDTTLSPTRQTIEVGESSQSLGEIVVPRFANLDARVLIGGKPARNIVVTAVEQGFNRYTYTATSDANGWVNLRVPNVPLDLTLQSPDSEQPITRLEAPLPGQISRIDLNDEGSLVSGMLLDPSGNPLPFALLEIRDAEGILLGTTLSDRSGTFRVTVALLEDFELDSGF
ncbi:MAG: hypothetical protein CL927_13005 [Deltaproteobacteria bacterium]|nr:hypothetical protein [Deltaproteobacteria bacterium]HCH66666.1 hypothetical protein [Deltaproteobacteria bacterium]